MDGCAWFCIPCCPPELCVVTEKENMIVESCLKALDQAKLLYNQTNDQ